MSSAPTLPALSAMLDALPHPAVLIGLDYRVLLANAPYRARYGSLDVDRGLHCYEVSHHYSRPCDQAGETCPLKNSLATGQTQRVLHLHYTPDGEEHVDVETLPIRNEHGEIAFFLEILKQSQVAGDRDAGRGLVGRSPSFTRMLGLIERVAASEAAVLLLGESGTGKELAAKAIHDASSRARGPYVPVDCSGLTETLFESELFGHERGAFTGAQQRKLGLVEAARGGTLFLDEVGDIPLSLQVKLLRLLETASFRRVGSSEPQQADFRLVCATHRDLKTMVAAGQFRQDLYYRISAFPIELPPLRARREDIALLAETLLKRGGGERGKRLSPQALSCLEAYDFPGNVRELRNLLERACLLADGDIIHTEHLPADCRCGGVPARDTFDFGNEVRPLDDMERRYIRWVLARHHGDNRELAKKLGLSERTYYRKVKALDES